MKRRPCYPLLAPIEPQVYLIDTSAWSDIGRRKDQQAVWCLITGLIKQERIVACAQVISELRKSGFYAARIKPYEQALQAGDRPIDDAEYCVLIGKITRDYPGMSKPTSRRTPADPSVVALACLNKYVVVANESDKRPNRKIPGVCKKLGVECITLDEFVRRAGSAPAEAAVGS